MTRFALLLILISVSALASPYGVRLGENADSIYSAMASTHQSLPDKEVFKTALEGYQRIISDTRVTSPVITIIDFTRPSTEKRLWVIDIEQGVVLHHTLVAHGRNSGDIYATKFSNVNSSLQSSLGFYITGDTYMGKHGLSMKLKGVEKGINDQAETRAIVMHGADYVNEEYIRKVGRLGRSWGCPAVPVKDHKEIIKRVAGGSCLFIYYPDKEYLKSTALL